MPTRKPRKRALEERAKMCVAMEYIVRQLNSEDILFDEWLLDGIADGDIPYGNLDPTVVEQVYLEDDAFQHIMECFLRCMELSLRFGGLYCGGIVAKEPLKE